ncbi:uncharacterized protein LOC135156639 [Lytechinus pictus]|uniref:uncharacterized protein LOC135156639 n=1 Tax=Lytechinus pictus TaxID=7653 RepID=UPI0030BA14F8
MSVDPRPTPPLRQTDFLPNRFSGDKIDRDLCTAHFLTFEDYLDAHDFNPTDPSQFTDVLRTFKRSLQGQARLWIEGQTFSNYQGLKSSFIGRFSGTKSTYAYVREFNDLAMTTDESAEMYLQRVRQAAARIGYGETQIRDKVLSSLPHKCRSAIIMSLPETAGSDEIAAKAQCFLDLNDCSATRTEVSFSTQDEILQLRDEIHSLKIQRDDRRNRPRSRDRTWRSGSRSRERSTSAGRSPYRTDNRPSQRPNHDKRRTICDYCLIPGHVWRACRIRQRDMEERQNRRRTTNNRQQDF